MRGLLVPVDAQTVELPREVGIALRPSPLGALEPDPPQIAVTEREPAELDRLGTTAVLDTLRLVDTLADTWTRTPPAQLRSGGVGVRDLRRTARDLGVDETDRRVDRRGGRGRGAAQRDARPGSGVPADGRLRHLAPARHRRTVVRPRAGLARDDPPAEPGRPARRARPGDHRARARTPNAARFPRCAGRRSPCSPRCRPVPRRSTLIRCCAGSPGRRRGGPPGSARSPRPSSPRPNCSASPRPAGSPATAARCSTAAAPSPSRYSAARCRTRSITSWSSPT